jgi:hypothetical protein
MARDRLRLLPTALSPGKHQPWRAGLPIHEALSLAEADLDQRRGVLLIAAARSPLPRVTPRVARVRRAGEGQPLE